MLCHDMILFYLLLCFLKEEIKLNQNKKKRKLWKYFVEDKIYF